MTNETYTVFDPFLGKKVEISERLTDRLRGRYASGPTLPNGEPEFGWREFGPTPPIQHEAAAEIERLTRERDEALDRALDCEVAEKHAGAQADYILLLRDENEKLREVLQGAVDLLDTVEIFVKSRQQISRPYGHDLFNERLAGLRAALSPPPLSPEKP